MASAGIVHLHSTLSLIIEHTSPGLSMAVEKQQKWTRPHEALTQNWYNDMLLPKAHQNFNPHSTERNELHLLMGNLTKSHCKKYGYRNRGDLGLFLLLVWIWMLLFSHSVVPDPETSCTQHAKLPCPSLSPGVCSYLGPLNPWCHPTISSSITSSPPAFNLSQHQGLFQWVSSHHVAKVLEL